MKKGEKSHSKNSTSLFPLIFLSKHISLYALGRLKWILDIIWPWNQHFNLKNQSNWVKQVLMIKFWSGVNCILLHWPKKLTLACWLCSNICVRNAIRVMMCSYLTSLGASFRWNFSSDDLKSVMNFLYSWPDLARPI